MLQYTLVIRIFELSTSLYRLRRDQPKIIGFQFSRLVKLSYQFDELVHAITQINTTISK